MTPSDYGIAVGQRWVDSTGDMSTITAIKAGRFAVEFRWGEAAPSAAVTLDEVLDELSKPSAIDGCEKGLALARDRIRCMRHPAQGVPDTAAPVPPKPEGGR